MKRPSPSLVISMLALFVSLGGTSYAATKYLITNVSQIKPSVVRALEQHTFSTAATAAPGAIGPSGAPGAAGLDGAEGREGREGAAGKEGAQGKEGRAGAEGAQGKEGAAGKEGLRGESAGPTTTTEIEQTFKLEPTQSGYLPARCPSGDVAVGGGWEVLVGKNSNVAGGLPESVEDGAPPANYDVDWRGEEPAELKVYAVCQS
jgi:Collagen triple helix repeat (20 copies)